jgi:hypothetical protein
LVGRAERARRAGLTAKARAERSINVTAMRVLVGHLSERSSTRFCMLVPLLHRISAYALERPGNVWQFMRQNWLSNRIFKSFDDIVDHPWNTLIDQPWKIMSSARRDWASVGYSM